MSITTKGGDKGQTSLLGGARVSKASLRVTSYGDVDELSACLGWARAELPTGVPQPLATPAQPAAAVTWEQLDREIITIQGDLFALAADLATPHLPDPRIGSKQVSRLEAGIAAWTELLPPQRSFILPGGSRLAAALHLARTVCRRAERHAVALSETETVDPQDLIYLNRLSDWLFLAARWSNWAQGIADQALS